MAGRLSRVRSISRVMMALAACGDPDGPDGGPFDSGIFDAEPREGGIDDARPDAEISIDAGRRDQEAGDVPDFDVGDPSLCEEVLAWQPIDLPLVATTSTSIHRGRFSCAGVGGGANAPERWIAATFDRPTHAIVRLGTLGWDAVLSVRTATCAPIAEVVCADAPTIVELPAVEGTVFIGVDGFTDGRGPFVLFGEVGPALSVPPSDSICEVAPVSALPVSRIGHNFGADPSAEIEGCPLTAPIFVPIDLAGGDLSVRVEPQAGQDLSVAVLSDCGDMLACAARGGAGHAETVERLSVLAGRAAIAIGTPPGARKGSFAIRAALAAECVSDVDCPLGERCHDNLTCGALVERSAISIGAEIPDDEKVSLTLPISGSTARPVRVRLRVAIEHDFPRDLVVTLSSPGGWPRVRLRDRLDGALDSVYGKDQPADGPGTMFDFGLTETATGAWILEVEDRAPGDVGRVTGAVLEVE